MQQVIGHAQESAMHSILLQSGINDELFIALSNDA